MYKISKLLGQAGAVFGLFAVMNANAATPTYAPGRVGMAAAPRMPTMVISPVNSTGNVSPNVPSGGNGGTTPPPVPSNCPDGGEVNSEYTVETCMNDVLACVNNGALPNGLNDMFNEDLRNSIVSGMGLCSMQVDRCISTVRKNCAYVYRAASDVWLDFNTRRVQPEYFSFVLRRTGLTPNQAENTCWLLDKNTYGSSFTAVANTGNVTAEYNQNVGAYNNQASGLGKNNPQGVAVNDGNPGVDGQRGHYARWDAVTGECLMRVAAYNGESHIKNSWLFGALGDDKPAEVWKSAGSAFSCNKDLFGFSLMNNTSTMAVVGIGGGTLVGAGVGALAGHGKRVIDCEDQGTLDKMTKALQSKQGTLNRFLSGSNRISSTSGIDPAKCRAIVELYDNYLLTKSAIGACPASAPSAPAVVIPTLTPAQTPAPAAAAVPAEIDDTGQIIRKEIIEEVEGSSSYSNTQSQQQAGSAQ